VVAGEEGEHRRVRCDFFSRPAVAARGNRSVLARFFSTSGGRCSSWRLGSTPLFVLVVQVKAACAWWPGLWRPVCSLGAPLRWLIGGLICHPVRLKGSRAAASLLWRLCSLGSPCAALQVVCPRRRHRSPSAGPVSIWRWKRVWT
jgi:hypothetical protein